MENLLDDDYLREFMERRMREMMVAKQPNKRFGFLADLSGGEEFLDAIDKEDKAVTVVVFIYEDGTAGCEPMHKALRTVSKDYPATKGWRGHSSLALLKGRKIIVVLVLHILLVFHDRHRLPGKRKCASFPANHMKWLQFYKGHLSNFSPRHSSAA